MSDFETAYYIYELVYSFKAILWVILAMIFIGILLVGVVEIPQSSEDGDDAALKYFKKSIYIGLIGIVLILSIVNVMPSQRLLAYKVVSSAEKELAIKDMSEARRTIIIRVIKDIVKDNKVDEK